MKLNDVCDFIVDCPHSTDTDEGKGYPIIRTPNIGKGRLSLDGVFRVSESVYNARNKRGVPQKNDLIFAREAPAGNFAIIKGAEKVCLGQRTVLLRPKKDVVYPDFLVYYLLAPRQQYNLLGTANGATVAHVNLPTIRNLPIELPSIEKQIKFGNILSAYDDLIENNRKQIKLLEEAAQRLYKEWFVDLRFPGWETTPVVDGLPEGWKYCSLNDAIFFNPTTKASKDIIKRSVPMSSLSTSSMEIDESQVTVTLSTAGAKFMNDDTLLARITPCLENGKTAFVSFLNDGEVAVGSTEFIVMRSKSLNPYMVYCISRSDEFRQIAINSMTGADGRQRVKPDKIEVISYKHPTAALIETCREKLKPTFDCIELFNKQIIRSRQARDALLPKLMSGEIEV